MSGRIQRLKYDKLNKLHMPKFRRLGLFAFVGGMFMLSLWLLFGEVIGATIPADYALNLDFEVTNTTSEDLDTLVPVTIDSNLLATFDLVNAGFTDTLFADVNDVVTKGLVQDISSATSTWFTVSTAPAGQIQIEQIFMTGPVAEHVFPAHLPNATNLEATNTTSLQVEDDLSAVITVGSTSCGTLQEKHDLELGDDASGWGLYFLGNRDFPEHDPQSWDFSSDKNQYYDITPIDDLILCGVSLGKTNFSSEPDRIRVQDVSASEIILDTSIVYYPQVTETGEGTVGLLKNGVELSAGTQYRVFIDFVGSSGHYATNTNLDVTSSIARYHHEENSVTFDGTGYSSMLFDSDGSELGLPQIVNAGMFFMNADITASTSTVLDISNSGILDATLNCSSLIGLGSDIRWNGSEATFTLSYTTTTGDLTLNVNGFPLTETLPSCELFGNKAGSKLSPAVASWENPADDRFMATLFSLVATSSVATLHVPVQIDRNLDARPDIEMEFSARAAIYDSARNLIASPPELLQTLVGTVNPVTLSFDFGSPVALSPGDYYLAFWAGDVTQSFPPSLIIDGNEELVLDDIDGASSLAQAIYHCIWIPNGAAGQNMWITIESVDVYLDFVNGSHNMRAAMYTQLTPFSPSWTPEFRGESDTIAVVTGWNTLTFDPPLLIHVYTDNPSALHGFDSNVPIVAFWSDETLHDVQFSIAINSGSFHGFPAGEVNYCFADIGETYPTWPDPLGYGFNRPNPSLAANQFLLWDVTYGEIIGIDVHAQSASSGTQSVEVDDVDYDGILPDPFVNDTPIANRQLNIWGDLIPISPSLISTSTVPYLAGAGLTGKVDDLSLTGSSGLALFTGFNPTNNSLIQTGVSGNDWNWQGLIQDGSGNNNDLTYTIVSDTTGIQSVLIPLGANAVPLSFSAADLPNIVGDPELAVFTTPGTVTPSTIMDKLRNVASNGDFPASMFWLMLGSLVLVALSSTAMRVISYDMVPWGISIVGFYLISVIAGPEFLILWVALNALYATGVLLIMNFSR